MKTLLAAVLVLSCECAAADQFYLTTGISCDKRNSKLIVWFAGAWNEAGLTAIDELTSDGLDPRKLVNIHQDANGRYTVSETTEVKTCRLANKEYTIEFSPFFGPGFQPEGLCATRTGAYAVVRLRGRTVATAGVDACTENGEVVTQLILHPGLKPRFKVVKAEDFYYAK